MILLGVIVFCMWPVLQVRVLVPCLHERQQLTALGQLPKASWAFVSFCSGLWAYDAFQIVLCSGVVMWANVVPAQMTGSTGQRHVMAKLSTLQSLETAGPSRLTFPLSAKEHRVISYSMGHSERKGLTVLWFHRTRPMRRDTGGIWGHLLETGRGTRALKLPPLTTHALNSASTGPRCFPFWECGNDKATCSSSSIYCETFVVMLGCLCLQGIWKRIWIESQSWQERSPTTTRWWVSQTIQMGLTGFKTITLKSQSIDSLVWSLNTHKSKRSHAICIRTFNK